MNDSLVSHHKRSQEALAKMCYPAFKLLLLLGRFAKKKLKFEGVFFAVRRAYWRAIINQLGAYSDISPNVVVKNPQGLSVGIRSCIGSGSFVDAAGGVKIGDYVMISHMVSINSITHPIEPPYHAVVKAETKINDYVWIGAGSIILEGCEIGEGAIVAAGSVVRQSVAPWTIVAGIPARHIKSLKKPNLE
ncbi:acyltransferase [Perlucidibaca aquatica]|uniref:acyltransferase n=1 Tax=Perlucidibaca aquatica TaxID=1852776 RepID=UPI00083A6CF8|nr:acyltransferase [Perlucidibaca aquatica]